MNKFQIVTEFQKDVVEQNRDRLRNYFLPHAKIKWHDSNELFSVDEYIIANCEYPDEWNGEIERIEVSENVVITVTKIWNTNNTISIQAVSFFNFEDNKILALDEYFVEDYTDIPQWRLDKKIGVAIK